MRKSIKRTLVALSICIPLVFVSLLLSGTVDYKSQILSFFPQLNNVTACRTASPPLRVYMYDLPPRFNAGLLDASFPENTPVTAANYPAWRWNDGLRRQHSVEYWMMASLLYEGNDESGLTRQAVRVSDPHSADVFFVPFFSSFSLNVYVHNMKESNTVDEKLQLEIVNILRASDYWKRSGGLDHVIPLHHPNAFRQYRHEVNASIFIVSDFGRIMNISRLAKDVVAPTYTWWNRGKNSCSTAEMLKGTKDVTYEEAYASQEGFKASAEQMRLSKFCLHPAGDTPSSCRLFDAIVSHCVPVIVSDRIELPFENELDYKEFSIFFSGKEALQPGYMVSELRKFPKDKWVKMWSQLRNISHHFEFQYPPKKDDAVNMIWRQVKQKVPAVNLAVHRSRRLKIPDWWR
ncbi:putative arabinosyltransferase A [Sesamum angolense]|uniref:Arabinosyltransferase A n=1 Tax=Sesamum angolense TaxID=2727404 RepID=A0AAE1WTY0_9LAMI|nr:putative arabinosyltransferase A [Sesamum angolense]